MPGMTPAVWGPMAWRLLHGLAHEVDRLPSGSPHVKLGASLLWAMARVLPCGQCRDRFTSYLSALGDNVRSLIYDGRMREAVWRLHNKVNRKLRKPELTDLEVLKRRGCVWTVYFDSLEILAFLYVVALNYNASTSDDKTEALQRYIGLLVRVLLTFGDHDLADALRQAMAAMGPPSQEGFFRAIHTAHRIWSGGELPSLEEVRCCYSMCRSDAPPAP